MVVDVVCGERLSVPISLFIRENNRVFGDFSLILHKDFALNSTNAMAWQHKSGKNYQGKNSGRSGGVVSVSGKLVAHDNSSAT